MNKMRYIPYDETIIYKIHVRGYTMKRGAKASPKGTFRGLMSKIPYWKELGVTTIECMPIYDFRDFPENYWGYIDGDYFAPKAEYCASDMPVEEVQNFVNALHEAGLECLLDFYFPVECTPKLALEVLQFWKKEYDIDGFVVSGEGVDFELFAKDEILADTKLMCASYNMRYLSKKAPKIKRLAEYNTSFQSTMRKFLRGDRGQVSAFLYYQHENPAAHGKIHYIANHDGFTLADLVSYDYRHNEANGEENLDGSNENYSWNCGVEGATRKKSILELRERQMRNAMMMVMFSSATPLIYGGDEFGNSQKGNSNPYCQDNEVGWIDWPKARANADFTQFVKDLIVFRKKHPILHMPRELKPMDSKGYGYPEISYHSQDAWYVDDSKLSRQVGILYCGLYAEKEDGAADDFIYMIYNMNEQAKDFALPRLPKGMYWYLVGDSGRANAEVISEEGKEILDEKYITAEGRTILVLVGK